MTRETHVQGEAAESREVRVRVLFFGAAREAAADEAVLTLAPGATARAAFGRILEEYPDLKRFRSSLLVAVNQEYARDLDVELEDGDELALFPPVSGGDGEPPEADDAEDFFELTTEPIDVGAVPGRRAPAPRAFFPGGGRRRGNAGGRRPPRSFLRAAPRARGRAAWPRPASPPAAAAR